MKSGIQITKDVAAGTLMTTTAASGGGLLQPEQADQFLDMLFDKTDLTKAVRVEKRERPTGSIQKMTIQNRIMRPKQEAQWDGVLTKPTFSEVNYECKQARIDLEITEDFYRRNIEKEAAEGRILNYIAEQIAVDREDLMLNGDTAYDGTTDKVFLTMNDGWIKHVKEGGHLVHTTDVKNYLAQSASLNPSKDFSVAMFYAIRHSIPSRYLTKDFRWIMNPGTASAWECWMLTQAASAGGIVTDNRIKEPAGFGIIEAPSMPDGVILFCDPKNLVMVTTYDIIWKTTTMSSNALRKDLREYAVFIETDAIEQELDATAIYMGFNPFAAPTGGGGSGDDKTDTSGTNTSGGGGSGDEETGA